MVTWHALAVEDVAASLGADLRDGLDPVEAARRLGVIGPNRLAEKKGPGLLARFFAQFADVLIYILLAAALVSLLLGELSDALIILAVVLVNAAVGLVQESRAEKALAALRRLSAPRALVVRGGERVEIDAAELVPGDLVVVDAGRVLPCDLRWIEAVALKIDEASLTGESVPVGKRAEPPVDAGAPLADRSVMGYLSTVATYGRGRGIAVATGMSTELGRIAGLLEAQAGEPTPLQRRLADFGRRLGTVILGLCAAIFLLALAEDYLRTGRVEAGTLFALFLTAVSLAVAAIPEGLPAIVTIVLAIGVGSMSRKKAIVRSLPAVEALGSVTMICSDKTGTLTRNRMEAVAWSADGAAGSLLSAGGGFVVTAPVKAPDPAREALRRFLEVLVLCNDARLGASQAQDSELGEGEGRKRGDEGEATGDPTEIALLGLARRAGVEREDLLALSPRLAELPFDSARKMMSVVHELRGERLVLTKGAADRLLGRCDRVMREGTELALDEGRRTSILAEAEAMAASSLRVLGAAFRRLGPDEGRYGDGDGEEEAGASLEEGLVFLGLVGMRDPPRLEVRDSIAICRASGIGVAMITGDHKATALAIARELGIAEREEDALSGAEIDALDDRGLADRLAEARVFARVTPEHKVRLVRAFRSLGHIVSMTGDGVNDAPSLKAADIGVAMGLSGTDVAKGASGIVLADDNFGTIVGAVAEGRTIYANIRRAILFLLSCNLGEILCVFLPLLLGLPLPLLPVHILWINLVTDTFPALALGMEAGDPEVMREKPRDPREGLFARGGAAFIALNGLAEGGLALIAYGIGLRLGGPTETEALPLARTLTFCVLGLSQLFHAFNCRNFTKSLFTIGPFGNASLVGAFLLCAALQSGVVAIPAFAGFFKVAVLDAGQWVLVWSLSATMVAMNEGGKALFRALWRGRAAREQGKGGAGT